MGSCLAHLVTDVDPGVSGTQMHKAKAKVPLQQLALLGHCSHGYRSRTWASNRDPAQCRIFVVVHRVWHRCISSSGHQRESSKANKPLTKLTRVVSRSLRLILPYMLSLSTRCTCSSSIFRIVKMTEETHRSRRLLKRRRLRLSNQRMKN